MAAKDTENRQAKTPTDPRAARLKAALKANLARRKAQARARANEVGADNDNKTPDATGKNAQDQ
ncbi:hypothetical protein [Roseicyclus sp.]|uniref:hypothetical protein n=1 Tax=Roseicyclus sp. TaxID=1914329 RepID=UPI003F6D5AA3